MRVEVVEECEHGFDSRHAVPDESWVDSVTHFIDHMCPGGVRRVLNLDEMVEKGAKVLADNDGIDPVQWHYDLARAVLVAALGVEERGNRDC